MERKSFVFYKEWSEAIKDLPDDVRLEIYESIVEYATEMCIRDRYRFQLYKTDD